jgi:hypothetical protein
LLRYCLRPQLSLERLSVAPGGKIVYQVKATRRGKATQRIMAPLDFMARLVALIPPSHHPLLRYFGVFAPHCSWRSSVVPVNAGLAEKDGEHDHSREQGNPPAAGGSDATSPHATSAEREDRRSPCATISATAISSEPRDSVGTASDSEQSQAAVRPRWYIDWATPLKRVHSVDALRCVCGGRLRFKQLVTDPEVAATILRSMGLPDKPPPVPKARSPAFDPDPPPADWD